jgi:beta-1,4-N-acetylglucosaminyltransferase
MIFLTIGSQFSFDRLVSAVDEAVGKGIVCDKVFAQIGDTSYVPKNYEHTAFLDKTSFDKFLKDASFVISHAGMGVISAALDNNKPLLVMPRLKKKGEAVNDHQMAIAKKYEQFGHLLVAYDETDLPEKIVKLRTFIPNTRHSQANMVAERIKNFLAEICPG